MHMDVQIDKLNQILPEKFDFYHLGNVELQNETLLPKVLNNNDYVGVGVTFQGDIGIFMVLLFEKGLDLSTYMEMGNILASRIATRLSSENIDVMISPPHVLNEKLLSNVLSTSNQVSIHRTYLHIHEGKTVPVETILMPYGRAGHA